MTVAMAMKGASILPPKSFQGSGLVMSAADFGNYSQNKIAYSFWYKATAGTTIPGTPFNADGSIRVGFTAISASTIGLQVISYHSSGGASNTYTTAALDVNTTLASWTNFLVHIDPLNSTPTDRIKAWVNGSADTPSSYDFSQNSQIYIGSSTRTLCALNPNVKMYQPVFISGSLPAISQVYAGGKPRDVRGIAGAYSYIDTTGDNITNDYFLNANWTNSSVTLSTDIPT